MKDPLNAYTKQRLIELVNQLSYKTCDGIPYQPMNGIPDTIVTDVKVEVYPMPQGKELASAIVVLNDCVMLRRLTVMDGENGLFVGYPVENKRADDYATYFRPITRLLRERIENAVLTKYQEAIA